MARTTQFVHLDETGLSDAVAVGLIGCMEACARARGYESLHGLRVAIQGCGAIGAAAARRVSEAGAHVVLCDVDSDKADRVAKEVGGQSVTTTGFLETECDILSPCAVGGVVTAENVGAIRAWALCGAANRILQHDGLSLELTKAGCLHVPDIIASAGAVVQGISRTVMGESDSQERIVALGKRAEEVLQTSVRLGESPHTVAERMARNEIGIP